MGKGRKSRKRTNREDSPSSVSSDSERDIPRHCSDKRSRKRKQSRHKKRRRHSRRTSPLQEHDEIRDSHVTRNQSESTQDVSLNPAAMAAPPVSTSTSGSLELVAAFKEIIQSMKTDNNSNLDRFPVLNVIPEFDPSKRNQTIETWILKVNQCAVLYNWNERQIIHYALPKLVGLAEKWYQGLPSLLFSWDEWQEKLRLAFPSDENYGQLLTEMLACKARFGESLEEYFYEKIVLLNRCKIFGKNAIDCILFGIEDRSVRTSAEAAQFPEPDKLLVFLRNIKVNKRNEKQVIPLQASTSDNRRHKFVKTAQSNTENRNPKCYNCGEDGHPYYKCKQPIKRCDSCHRVGHLASDCPVKVSSNTSKTVLQISQEENHENKYFKSVIVNGHELDCFVDFGSQCTMVRESVAKKIFESWSTVDLPVLRGFGDSVVSCLGKCTVTIKLDGVVGSVETLIVPDHLLRVSLLVGQTFTEQDHVIVVKTKDNLKFASRLTKEVDKIKLYISESVIVNGLTKVIINSLPPYDGDLVLESSLSQKPNSEYEIIQSVIRLAKGIGYMFIRGLNSSEFTLKENVLIARALPLNELSFLHVNNVISNNAENITRTVITQGMITVNENLSQLEFGKLTNLLNEFRECFAFSIDELGCVTDTEMKITLEDTTPVVYRPYRLPHCERQVVRDIVSELEESGIVRQSTSEYAHPVLLVRKKTGDYRLCVDFRSLNKKTVKEHYPLPRIDDQLDNLSGYKFYTSLDLASGYYQIPLAESSKPLTAFVTPDGHYEFTRMPFGLANAPSTFQRTINNILGNARFKDAFAYMDDVIIPSKTVDEGFQKLRDILVLFRNSGLTLKLPKCNFFMQSIDYLGFEICEDGIRPGKKKIQAVENFPIPTDQHKVRQFVGLASFFRRFIRGFSNIARPLTQLLKKNSKWHWGETETDAFNTLKGYLLARPILAFYNPSYETQLHTDASKMGVAGILMQRPNKDAPFSAIAYYSRQTSPEESRFSSYDLETLAVVTSLQRFRVYLLGISFTIVTDCNSLRATFEKRDILPRIARWWSAMQEYNFNIVYKPGATMSHVDALSRNPVESHSNFLEVRSIDVNWISTVQQNDSELQRIVEILNDKDTDTIIDIKNNFILKRGLLYRKTTEGDRWVVPKGVRWHVLKANHDDIGHFGFDKTYHKIKNDYWFPKMRRFIKKYVNSCLECAYAKVPSGKKAGQLHPIEKVERPFHTIHIDHLGPFVRSKKKNSYLLLIIDAFTKFIVLIPVKSTKSIHSLRAMKHYFHTFSVPNRLISDRGTSFTAKKFQKYLESLGIKHVMNAVATPRANGQIERYNRTVLAALTASNHGKPENSWDECISEVQWGLNNTHNKGIGKTPAQALFGMNTRGPSDSLISLNTHGETDILQSDIDVIRNEISEHITNSQTKQKHNFDKKRKNVTFNVGDLVRVEREIPSSGKSRKLVPKLRGPYRITEILDKDRYVITDTPLSRKGNKNFSGIFSVDKIHPWLVFDRTSDVNYSDTDSDE